MLITITAKLCHEQASLGMIIVPPSLSVPNMQSPIELVPVVFLAYLAPRGELMIIPQYLATRKAFGEE
jgi:hypothetical protein